MRGAARRAHCGSHDGARATRPLDASRGAKPGIQVLSFADSGGAVAAESLAMVRKKGATGVILETPRGGRFRFSIVAFFAAHCGQLFRLELA